ncbi:MAG: hypothetical protein Q9200_005228 [Gallowayella weberi]
MVEGALITGGICFSYWLDFGFSFLDPNSIAWRFPIGFQIFFALVILVFVLELPESPRWLVLKGKEDEALNVLGALSDKPSDDPFIWGEFQAIKDTVIENQKAGGIKDLNEIKLDPFTSRILAAANGTEYFLASWIAVFTIEKFGRRQLMLFGAVGMSFSMAMLAIMDSIGGKGPGIVAALFLFLFNTFFAVGWLGMTCANWIFNFMAYRSLEEMDSIFRKCDSVFTVVKIAKEEPQRYGKSGELLIRYEETEEHRQRQASVVSAKGVGKIRGEHVDDVGHPNPDYSAENGTGDQR